MSCFLSGLQEDIRFMIRMFNPHNLHVTFGLAKMQEENADTLKKMARIGPGLKGSSFMNSGPIGPPDNHNVIPIQRLSPAQMKERRDLGLCYNCDDKWAPGHICKSAKLFLMDKEDTLGPNEPSTKGPLNVTPPSDDVEPAISIHALTGSLSANTMHFLGWINGKMIVLLLDTGSTHNFMDYSALQKTQLPLTSQAQLSVKIANGQTLFSAGHCTNVSLQIQGNTYLSDFYILTLGWCDLVLGIEWLQTLGSILWDFENLQMEFSVLGQHQIL